MFDKTLNAFSKFATLGRNARPGKDRKRRASIGDLTFAAYDTNNDRDDARRSKTLQRSTAIDLNSDVVLQLNKGLMRRSQSTESLNISLHHTWRTIDIDIDSPPTPVDDYEENPYQDLNVLPQSRNNEGNNSHAESESGSDQDVETVEINNDFHSSAECENLYEDTDFVREVLNSSRLPQVKTVTTSIIQVKEPPGVPDNGLQRTTTTTTTANSPNQNHSTNQTHVQVGAVNSEKVTNLDKRSNIKESQSDDDNTPIDDECDTDNEYHDTVVKDLNVIEISEQGIVSRLRTAEAEEGLREEVDGGITESMDNYFQRMGIMRVDDDEEEEEEEEEIEEDGIKSKRQLDEIEQELHLGDSMEDNEEAMLELNEVLNKFEMIEEDTRKDVEDIDTNLVIHTETKTKPKLLPKPKPKPPLKPKPLLRPAKSLGTLHSSGTKKVGAIVTSFECESLPKVNVQLQAPSLVTKASAAKMKQSCDTGGNENVHKPGGGSMSSDSVRPKEIASKLTAIFAKESAMRPVKPPPLSPKPSPPALGGTGGGSGFVGKSRFDSECESLHSGTDLSCSSEQSSGTGSIGSPNLLPLPVQVPSPCVLPKPWSDQSSMTSYDGPNCSISSSEDFPSEQQQQFSEEDDGDDILGNNGVTSRTRAGTKVGAKGRGRQVSQRWQRNHLKKVSAQLQSGGGVKRTFNKIQNAENLKRFSNYLANKRP